MNSPGRENRNPRGRHWPAYVGSLLILALLAGPATGQPIPSGDTTVKLEPVAAGLVAPVTATHAGDGSGRLFIVEQSGQVRILKDGVVLPAPFLDISDKIPTLNAFFDERGLLGLAFHPDYETNGRFFVRYSAPRDGGPDDPCTGTSRGCHREVLSEFAVSADSDLADAASEQILFQIDEPQFNHDAGDVAFGPDGYLYFTLGDGGGARDGLADVPPSHGPIGHGQNIETTLGSVLRIDVDGGAPYAIPPDNPFVGAPGADEIYAYGMRNPYRFSFDDGPGGTGRLFLADVGQNLFEEVNIVEKGGNYGWVVREGLHCFDPFNPLSPPAVCSDTGPIGEPLLDPIVEYSHPGSGFFPEGGITVVGGYVYRGTRSPGLNGRYVFGDFAQQFVTPTGSLYELIEEHPDQFEIRQLNVDYDLFLKGFGEGEDGEVYACGSTALAPFGDTGRVDRIVAVEHPGLDIKPGSCPNPLNTRSRGRLPVAIAGTDNFDVGDIDRSSLVLTRAGSTLAFVASLDGAQANAGAGTGSPATGQAFMTLNLDTNVLTMELSFSTLLGTQTVQHVHGPAAPGQNAGVAFGIPGPGGFDDFSIILDEAQKQTILDGLAYINVHSTFSPGGEIRGQILPAEVRPVQIRTEDVATPFGGDLCDCHTEGADGIADLSLKFDTQEVVSTLGLEATGEGFATLAVVGRLNPGGSAGEHVYSFPIGGDQENPPRTSGGNGSCTVILDEFSGDVSVSCTYAGLEGDAIASHIHGLVGPDANAGVILPLTASGGTSGVITGGGTLDAVQVQGMLDGLTYVNLHSTAFPPGELRGQVVGGEFFGAEDCVRVQVPGSSNTASAAYAAGDPSVVALPDPAPHSGPIVGQSVHETLLGASRGQPDLPTRFAVLKTLAESAEGQEVQQLIDELNELIDAARAAGLSGLVREGTRLSDRLERFRY